jgi:hypothetical protein
VPKLLVAAPHQTSFAPPAPWCHPFSVASWHQSQTKIQFGVISGQRYFTLCHSCELFFLLDEATFYNTHVITTGGQDKNWKIFLPYGRSIGSWICLTHKTYTCHTVQNTYSASMAVSNSESIFRFNLCCLSYSALFHFLTRMCCTSMGVWGSMIY